MKPPWCTLIYWRHWNGAKNTMKEGCHLGNLNKTNKQPSLIDLPHLRSKNYRTSSQNPTCWLLSNNTKTWLNLTRIFSFDFTEFSINFMLNLHNTFTVSLNITRPPRYTLTHQGLPYTTKSMNRGPMVWVISTWETNKENHLFFYGLTSVAYAINPSLNMSLILELNCEKID
jgi:hypothetical protein